MNGQPPVASKILLKTERGSTSGLSVQLDEWPDGGHSVKIATYRPRPGSGGEPVNRSVTIYPRELKEIAVSLALAHKTLGLPV